MRRFLIHIAVFGITLLALWMFLICSALIPNESIKQNMEKSALSYGTVDAFNFENAEYLNAVSDNYADCILLSVSYYMGEGNALFATLDSSYYRGENDLIGVNQAFLKTVTEEVAPDTDYSRYWHGTAAFARVIHLFGDVRSVKAFGFAAFVLFALVTVIMLLKQKNFKSALALTAAILCIHPWNLSLSMEYQSPFIICFLLCPFYLYFERRNANVLTLISVIGGVATAFFDFLTCETVAILIPVLLVISVRIEENRFTDIKKEAKLAFYCIAAFGISWAATFALKWGLASPITGENKFAIALSSAQIHTTGTQESARGLIFLAPLANLTVLFCGSTRLDIPRVFVTLFIIALILISVLYLFGKKNLKRGQMLLPISLGCAVFLRYAILNYHSYMHEFFTYRALIAPIFAIFASTLFCLEFKTGKRGHRR